MAAGDRDRRHRAESAAGAELELRRLAAVAGAAGVGGGADATPHVERLSGAPHRDRQIQHAVRLYLPVTMGRAGQALDVWGCIRPAPNAGRAGHRRQSAQLQFSSGGAFRTVATIAITGRHGYFEVRQRFPASGRVRLVWNPPHGATEFSRTVDITLS